VKLGDQLLLPAIIADSPEAVHNRASVVAALAARRRMPIIAPLDSYSAECEERMSQRLGHIRLSRASRCASSSMW